MNTTSVSLLERLKTVEDGEAWARFVQLYTPLLYYWCRRVGLRETDAADLIQDVLVQLVRKLPDFRYDAGGSFRNWLRTITMNKWRERQRKRQLPVASGDGIWRTAAAEQVTIDDPQWILDDAEYRQHLVRSALQLIRAEFSETTWRAFELHVLEQHRPAEVTKLLGIRVGTVYAAKSRVLTRLRQELSRYCREDF